MTRLGYQTVDCKLWTRHTLPITGIYSKDTNSHHTLSAQHTSIVSSFLSHISKEQNQQIWYSTQSFVLFFSFQFGCDGFALWIFPNKHEFAVLPSYFSNGDSSTDSTWTSQMTFIHNYHCFSHWILAPYSILNPWGKPYVESSRWKVTW